MLSTSCMTGSSKMEGTSSAALLMRSAGINHPIIIRSWVHMLSIWANSCQPAPTFTETSWSAWPNSINAKTKNSYLSYDAIWYIGSNGTEYPEKMNEERGFDKDDVVKVEVTRSTRTVKYMVNGFLKATQNNSMLADINKLFMPYVEMYDAGDAVRFMVDWANPDDLIY